jgi:ribonuclease-3
MSFGLNHLSNVSFGGTRQMKARAHISLQELQSAIGYQFHDPQLLETALTHKSYMNEHPEEDAISNERLEFLGDAVLDLAISHLLMEAHPQGPEGMLSRWRAAMVNEKSLAGKAQSLDLGRYLLLGRGEERTRGRTKRSLLADAYEAVLAAIYLDGGFTEAFQVIKRQFRSEVLGQSSRLKSEDFKTKLQEYTQSVLKITPRYVLVGEEGPDHDKMFHVELDLGGDLKSVGRGRSKKDAEQWAAREMLDKVLAVEGSIPGDTGG